MVPFGKGSWPCISLMFYCCKTFGVVGSLCELFPVTYDYDWAKLCSPQLECSRFERSSKKEGGSAYDTWCSVVRLQEPTWPLFSWLLKLLDPTSVRSTNYVFPPQHGEQEEVLFYQSINANYYTSLQSEIRSLQNYNPLCPMPSCGWLLRMVFKEIAKSLMSWMR